MCDQPVVDLSVRSESNNTNQCATEASVVTSNVQERHPAERDVDGDGVERSFSISIDKVWFDQNIFFRPLQSFLARQNFWNICKDYSSSMHPWKPVQLGIGIGKALPVPKNVVSSWNCSVTLKYQLRILLDKDFIPYGLLDDQKMKIWSKRRDSIALSVTASMKVP